MAKTTAQDFYSPDPGVGGPVSQDGGWGTDVQAMFDTPTSNGPDTTCAHPNSAGTTTITVDPFSSRSTQNDVTSDFGWAWNAIESSDDSIGSSATDLRFMPAGQWTFYAGLTIPAGGAGTGSHNVTLTWKVYRVGPSPSYTRTLLFTTTSTELSGGLFGVTNSLVITTSASQPEYLLAPDETAHVGFTTTDRQVAGVLGATTAGTIVITHNSGGGRMFRVPAPGIRTKSVRDYSSVGVGAGSRQALGIAKDFDATAVGAGTIDRDWQAFRLFSAVGEADTSLDKKLSLSLPATGIGSSVRTAKVFKDTFDAVGEGASTRTAKVSKDFDLVEGVGAGSIEREWQAYRQFDAAGQGVGSIDRVVTFVRQFDAIGVGEISSFRLCLDADELPDPGGGGSVTNYIFGVFE